MTRKIDFYGESLSVYKANLHMHSVTSDGVFTLSELVALYKQKGYDILAATDHWAANRVSEVESGEMLLVSGMEYHPVGPRGLRLHLVALNVPEDFENPSEMPFQDAMECVRNAGGETVLAHPYWSGFNCADIMQIKNIIGIEVYNTSTRYIGKAYNMQVWDNILQMGYFLPAIAVDDTHRVCDLFRGWTMVCAREKTVEATMDALKSGSFYSSQGPEFYKLSFENNIFSAEFSSCEEVIIMGDCAFGRPLAGPGFEAGKVDELDKVKAVTSLSVEIPSGLSYIRCQIRDANGRYAWSNPIKLK